MKFEKYTLENNKVEIIPIDLTAEFGYQTALLQRATNPITYIVARGFKVKKHNTCEWDNGYYYNDIRTAVEKYSEYMPPFEKPYKNI